MIHSASTTVKLVHNILFMSKFVLGLILKNETLEHGQHIKLMITEGSAGWIIRCEPLLSSTTLRHIIITRFFLSYRDFKSLLALIGLFDRRSWYRTLNPCCSPDCFIFYQLDFWRFFTRRHLSFHTVTVGPSPFDQMTSEKTGYPGISLRVFIGSFQPGNMSIKEKTQFNKFIKKKGKKNRFINCK